MKLYFGRGNWDGVEQMIYNLDKLPSVLYNESNDAIGFDFDAGTERVKSVNHAKYIWAYYSVYNALPNDINDAFNFASKCGVSEITGIYMIQNKFGLTREMAIQEYEKWRG